MTGFDGGSGAIDLDRITEALEHALGMVAGGRGLGHGCGAGRIQPRQQNAGFDLSAGHGHLVVHAHHAAAALDAQRRTPLFTGVDLRAHFAQRFGHAAHRALGQRRIAGQYGVKVLPGQQARQQAHGRTGVAQIQRAGRRLQTVQTNAIDSHATMMRAFNHHTHVTECLQSCQAVFAFQEAFDLGHTLSQGAEHDRAMGNGLVTGHADTAVDLAAGAGNEVEFLSLHRFHVGPAGQNSAEMLSCRLGSGKHTEQRVGVAGFHRLTQSAQVLGKGIKAAQDRIPIGQKNIAPHHRITRGNAGKVPEATGSVAENLQILVTRGQGIHQRKRQQMRQVAGSRQDFIMVGQGHALYVCPQRLPATLYQADRLRRRLLERRENHLVVAKQIRPSCLDAAFFRTGNRMARHKVGRYRAKDLFHRLRNRTLGTADIGNHGIAQLQRRQLRQHGAHTQHRHGQHDQIGALHCLNQIGRNLVDHAQRHRLTA